MGTGRLVMQRLVSIAVQRKRDILMYALLDAVPFYESFGFCILGGCSGV